VRSGIDWAAVWAFVWPILKQGLIAGLVALLGLLGYDKYVPSRFVRREETPRPGSGAERLGLLKKGRG